LEVILPYIYDPSKLQEGGGIRYTYNLVNCLIENNVIVSVLGVKLMNKQKDVHPNFKFIPILEGSESWWKYFLKLMLKVPFLRLTKSAIIHTQRTYFMLPFILFCPNNPKVCTLHMKPLEFVKIHYPQYFKIINKFYTIIDRYCVGNIDALIAINNDVKRSYLERYPELEDKIHVIFGTGVDLNKFMPMDKKLLRTKYGLKHEEAVILFAGRLEKIKNVDFLIRAFSFFKNEISASKLIIVGRGSEQEYLESLAKNLGLNEDVLFLGEIPPENMPEIYNCSDIFALTSHSESSPTVVREALSCGVPIVSTKVGDVPLIITDYLLGSVVDTFDEKLFSEKLLSLMKTVKDNPEKSSVKCRDVAIESFGFEKIADNIIEVYSGLTIGKTDQLFHEYNRF
jgi:glycosyltransferase involved in cell wall biosynthesis